MSDILLAEYADGRVNTKLACGHHIKGKVNKVKTFCIACNAFKDQTGPFQWKLNKPKRLTLMRKKR